MKLLAIGNSFSQDALKYLHRAALAQGEDIETVNLFIGGCTLEQHAKNLASGAEDYDHEINGEKPDRKISVGEALTEDDWNVVTLQQASGYSGWGDSYEPFLTELIGAVRHNAKNARILFHETWAYEKDSDHRHFGRYCMDQQKMFEALRGCVQNAAREHHLEVIPVGDAVQTARTLARFDPERGGVSICRDGFHLSRSAGRYLASLVWLKKLTGVSVADNPFVPDDPKEEADPLLLEAVRAIADYTA